MINIKKKLYIETYGCQMNFSDSEIVASVLSNEYQVITDIAEADLIFLNTCSIRENAESRIWKRLSYLKSLKKKRANLKIGVLGCMAERLKEQLIEKEKIVDIVVGPDSYRNLPILLNEVSLGKNAINVILSEEETYADISPIRYDSNGVSAFISIMRGCQNFCSYCVVPYTRGKERSRNPETIVAEAKHLFQQGYREITLLGQNVNSYNWNEKTKFHTLLKLVSEISPFLRVRFATSHPKDISDELIYTIAAHSNICKSIHLPVQSGSSRILEKMNRKYSREWYLERIKKIKNTIPDISISTDIITGFCSETEEEHNETLSIMKIVEYDFAFMFKYSEREGTTAAKKFIDDVAEDIKSKRLDEIIKLQTSISLKRNKQEIGKTFEVLIEGESKRSSEKHFGRTSQNKVVVFAKQNTKKGEYANVLITSCTSGTLIGELI